MLFKPVLPVLEYVVLYDYIKNELCINKEKPALQCNGKCHLMKEMAKAADSNSDTAAKKHFSVESNWVFYQEVDQVWLTAVLLPYVEKKVFIKKVNSYVSSYLPSVFRPPIFIS